MTTADKNYIISQMANIVNADANGVITGLNTASYTSNLGPVGNVTITGGSNGQVLTTNGSGVLDWSTISTNNVANANYAAYAGNVTVAAQSNITSVGTLSGLTVSGTSNLGAVGNVTITGGSNGQMLSTNGSSGLSWTTVSAPASAQTGEFRVFFGSPPDSTWLPASSGPYNVSSYPALGAILGTATVTAAQVAATGGIQAMAYGGGRYVAIMTGNPAVTKYSTDGVTWSTGGTLPSSPGGWPWSGFSWNGSVFFAVSGDTGSRVGVTSPDGVTWTTRTLPAINGWFYNSTCGTGSTLVALQVLATSGNCVVAKSTDNGATWTSTTMPVSGGFDLLAFGGGKYITARGNSTIGYWSTDAVTWTAFTLPSSLTWSGAEWNGYHWIMTSANLATTMAISYDGINWTSTPTPGSVNTRIYKPIWNGARWVLTEPQIGTLRWAQTIDVGWSSQSLGAIGVQGQTIVSDGTGTSAVVYGSTSTSTYKYTFVAPVTFSVGSGPVSVSRGTWFIKS